MGPLEKQATDALFWILLKKNAPDRCPMCRDRLQAAALKARKRILRRAERNL